jgi:glycine dehydrogenase subunit 1
MYDGASAAAEAVLMAKRLTRREGVLVSGGVHPHYRETIDTYLQGIGEGKKAIRTVPLDGDGTADFAALESLATADLACIVVGYPNFFGCVVDVRRAAELAHRHGALLITVTQDPFALSLLEPPGALGADIAVGEGQALGIPLQFGGPYAGLFACREGRDFLQQIPGRLAGETVDKHGERGYVLTLSTREQHIRRERATSNICTNTGLCALAVTIRMSMIGKQGFIEAGRQGLAKAEYLKGAIAKLKGYSLVYPNTPTFNEFVVRVRGASAAKVVEALEPKGFLAGLDLGRIDPKRADQLLIAVTESRSRGDLDGFIAALDAV